MDIKVIKALANIVREAQLSYLEVEDAGFRVTLKNDNITGRTKADSEHTNIEKNVTAEKAIAPVQSAMDSDPGLDFNVVHTVKSPMVGVFYSAPGPDQEPFVKVGSKVKKGNVLCIIEAMKLMNEVLAEKDGEIVDICVKNGEVVEYGQILFKIF